jgi:hypothetical protein
LPKGINALEKHFGCGNPLFATKNEFNGFNFNNTEEVSGILSDDRNTNMDISYLNYNRLKTEGILFNGRFLIMVILEHRVYYRQKILYAFAKSNI